MLTGVQLIDAVCDKHQWWQEQRSECVSCTVCDDQKLIVLRPCQPHSDTVCGTLEEIATDLEFLKAAAVAAEHKHVSLLKTKKKL